MKQIELIIADPDARYMESLANYIRNSEFANRFDVKLFSQSERLQQYLQAKGQHEILLASENLLPPSMEQFQIESVITLEDAPVQDQTDSSQHLFKYQPLSNLLSQVIRIHYEGDGTKPKNRTADGETSVISVYAASGGTGKTTVAYNLARKVAAEDKKVFYLNLELINPIPLLFDTEDKPSSSPLLYYLKTNADQLVDKLQEMTITDEETNIDYLNLLPSAEEVIDLTEEDVEVLLDQLIASKNYHYIILDLASTVNPVALKALKKSNQVLWLMNNDVQSFYKTSYLMEELHGLLNDGSFSDRVKVILNRYTGKVAEPLLDFQVKIDAYLPYVPEWKQVVSGEQLASVQVFNDYIAKLYREHVEVNQAGGVTANG